MNKTFPSKRVLVADNSPLMTKIIKKNLVALGFDENHVLTVHNGHQASLMLEMTPVDLVTSGVHMHPRNGLQLLEFIRHQERESIRNLPFLVISAERKKYFAEKLDQVEVSEYLHKPFTPEQLQEAILKCLEGAAASRSEASPGEPFQGETGRLPANDLGICPTLIEAFIESTQEALGQYMVSAVAESPLPHNIIQGYFHSFVDLEDADHGIKLTVGFHFPKEVACSIYETLFGEVDTEQVCGVVQELNNIAGGIVKPKISDRAREILSLVAPHAERREEPGRTLNLALGLPLTRMGEDAPFPFEENGSCRFFLPFDIQGDKIVLSVGFHSSGDLPDRSHA